MNKPTALLAACAASVVTSPVYATSDDSFDQIVVTGSRTPIAAADVGNAITIISRDEIERRQARYVSDLLRAVPGFAVSHTGVAGSQTQVRVRGSEANHVLVMIDGVRANDPATGDEFRWEYLATANIERIEIVRGPQSALWGSDAIGGVVHIITRSDSSSAPGLGAYVEGGSDSTLNGALNGSISYERWSVGFGIERLATDGSNISRTGDEDDDSDVTTISLNSVFEASDELTVRFAARTVDAYSQYDAVDFFTTGLPADSDVATETTQNYAQLGLTIGASGDRLRHHVTTRWFDSDNDDLVDGVENASSASDRLTFAYQADLALATNTLSFAIEHERTRFEQRGAVVFDDPNQDQDMDVTSAIADARGRVAEDVTWLLSARFDDHSDFEDVVTGRASMAWHIDELTTLRASIGTGQKTPTFIERFGYFPLSFAGNPELEPEKSTSFEVGLNREFGVFGLEVNLFRQDLEDEINGFHCPNPWPAPCTAMNMDGTSERSGVELGTRWEVSERLGLGLNYTYTDTEDADSAAELRRPRHAGSAFIDAAFAGNRGRLSLAADYGGTRRDVFFPPWPNPVEIVTLENYWLVDMTLQYQLTESIKLFARGSNLLDTEYEQVYGYRTPGRAAFAGVRIDIGR